MLVVWRAQSASMRAATSGSTPWPAFASTEQQHPRARASGPPGASSWVTEWPERAGSWDVSDASWSTVTVRLRIRPVGRARTATGRTGKPDAHTICPTCGRPGSVLRCSGREPPLPQRAERKALAQNNVCVVHQTRSPRRAFPRSPSFCTASARPGRGTATFGSARAGW